MKVQLTGPLVSRAGGQREFEVEAGTIHQMLSRLTRDYPVLEEMIEEGVSVAVDGTIYNGDFSVQVKEGSEMVLMIKIVGG